jgi:dipeptidyl-peptidase-4
MKALIRIATMAIWPVMILSAQVGNEPVTIADIIHEEMLVSPGPGSNQLSFIRPRGREKSAGKTIQVYDVQQRKESLLFDPASHKEKIVLPFYGWSPRGDALLLKSEGDLWLFETASGQLRRLTDDSDEEQEPTFSPTGDCIAFVKKNNLYVLSLKSGAVRQLTSDGRELILNGILDWVYGEELALRASARAYKWSPDGKSIAFLRLDDRPVPEYPLTNFLSVHAQVQFQRFPQPGDPNPIPSFRVVGLEEGNEQTRTFPLNSTQVEYILPAFSWTADAAEISLLTLNRAQTDLTVHLWNPISGQDHILFAEKDPYWINPPEPPLFLTEGNRFLWLSERDGWRQLYLYTHDGKLLKQLTRGNWMIDSSLFQAAPAFQADERADWVYFTSTEKDPRERQLYRARLDGGGLERLTREAGHHTLSLSPEGKFLVDVFSSIDVPPETRLLG